MAINAKFEADFSSFQSEVNKAVVSLNTFQKSSEDVAKSLGRMVDRYSGEKIIAKGLEINRLFQTTNDLAILTEKELTEVGRTAAEAADKMARMGLAVPDNLKAIASEATKATSQTNDLHGAFQQFDKMLAAVGINIGTEIGAVGELAAAFGQTASQLGLVATAGLAAGTMFASFKLTTLLLELTGLNTQLNKFVDGLAGLPEAAAGAKLDELARAGQNAAKMLGGAQVTITDLATAQRINAEAVRQHNLELVTSTSRIAAWNAELKSVQDRGEMAQLTDDFKSQAFELKELETRYALSAGAVQLFVRQQGDAEEAAKNAAETQKRISDQQLKDMADYAKALEAQASIMTDFEIKTHALAMKNEKELREERDKNLQARNAQVVAGFQQIQALEAQNLDYVRKQTLSETDYKLLKIDEWAKAEIAAFKGTTEELARFTEQVKIRADQQKAALEEVIPIVTVIGKTAAEVEAERKKAAKGTGDVVVDEYRRQQEAFMSFQGVVVAGTHAITDAAWQGVASQQAFAQALSGTDAAAAQWQLDEAKRYRGEIFLKGMSGPRLGVDTRASGGQVAAGTPYLVGEMGPEIFRPASSGTIIPNGAGGTMVNNFYVNGSIQDLARPLMDELTRLMKTTRQWPAA